MENRQGLSDSIKHAALEVCKNIPMEVLMTAKDLYRLQLETDGASRLGGFCFRG